MQYRRRKPRMRPRMGTLNFAAQDQFTKRMGREPHGGSRSVQFHEHFYGMVRADQRPKRWPSAARPNRRLHIPHPASRGTHRRIQPARSHRRLFTQTQTSGRKKRPGPAGHVPTAMSATAREGAALLPRRRKLRHGRSMIRLRLSRELHGSDIARKMTRLHNEEIKRD
jgi:hypothetical protein